MVTLYLSQFRILVNILLHDICVHGNCLVSTNCFFLSVDPNSSQSHSICLRANRLLKTKIMLILFNTHVYKKTSVGLI